MQCQGAGQLVLTQGDHGEDLQTTHGGEVNQNLFNSSFFQMSNLGHDLDHVLGRLPEETKESETKEEMD